MDAKGKCGRYINIKGNGGKATFEKSSGVVDVHDVVMESIAAVGGAQFNAYGGLDNGGNLNWNWYPNAPRTLYWVNSDGYWNDTMHWSLISGGPGGECIPTRIDDVIIDSNSYKIKFFNQLTILGNGECLNFLWKDVANTSFTGVLNVYGAFNISSKIDSKKLEVNFMAVNQYNLIKTNAKTIKNIWFYGKGSWYLYDSLIVKDSIYFNSGYLDTRNQFVKTTSFNSLSNSLKRLDMGNSTFELKHSWSMNSDSLTLNCGKSNIKYTGGTASTFYLMTSTGRNPVTYYNVSIEEERVGKSYFNNRDSALINFNKVVVYNDGIFNNQYIFDSLMFSAGNTYKFQANMTQTIHKHWQIRGNNCYAINLESTKMYTTAYVTKPDNVVSGDFINMRDIHALGNCTYYAGAFSTDISNNSGWNFYNGPNYVYGLGPDTNFALGGNIILDTKNFNGTSNTLYHWSTGSTHDTIVVNQTGWYWVTVSYASDCEVVDSIFVGCRIDLNYSVNHNPCYGDSLGSIQIVIPDSSYKYSYIWNTGDTNSHVFLYPAGIYKITVIADSGKCQTTDTIEINQPPKIFISQGDTSYCENDSVQLNLGFFFKYHWDDGYNAMQRWVAKPDTFLVYVEDSKGCLSDVDTIKVSMDSLPVVNLGADTVICLYEIINVTPGLGFDSYLWGNGNTNSIMPIYYPGTYWVTIRKNSCVITDSILVENCPPELSMPNVFTPNNDGFNDFFKPVEENNLDFTMKIYNRWGMKIYETDDLKTGWDGTSLGNPAVEGVYFYVIEYREWLGNEAGLLKKAQGAVTLIRNSNVK